MLLELAFLGILLGCIMDGYNLVDRMMGWGCLLVVGIL